MPVQLICCKCGQVATVVHICTPYCTKCREEIAAAEEARIAACSFSQWMELATLDAKDLEMRGLGRA